IFYTKIEPFFNNSEFSKAYSDKTLYDLWFNKSYLPNTILKNINGIMYNREMEIVSFSEIIEELSRYRKLIIKASIESGWGKNINVITYDNKEELKEKISYLKEEENFVVQEFINQHAVINNMNPSSVNTIRIMTLLNNDMVHYLSAHI